MQSKVRWLATTVVIAAFLFLTGAVLPNVAPAAATPLAQATAPRTITLYGPTAVTTGTTYSSAPLTVQGNDLARITNYSDIVVFVATDANSSGYLTVTLQASPDETIWADVTEVVHTFDVSGTLNNSTYSLSKSLSGGSQTGMIRSALLGEFTRVKVAVTGAVTPTIKATLR